MLRQMTEDGFINQFEKGKCSYCQLNEDIINKVKYILLAGHILPLDIDSLASEYVYSEKDFDTDKICSDKNELIKYLKNLISVESVILSYKKRYNSLYKLRLDTIKNGIGDLATIQNEIEEKISLKRAELKQFEKNIPSEPILKSTSVKLDINEPIKPELKAVKPAEPIYEKPGLFNKRKVEENNMRLKMNYEHQLQLYEEAYAEYQRDYQSYINNSNEYQEKLKEQQKIADEESRQAFNRELKSYDDAMQEYWSVLSKKKEELKQLKANSVQMQEELLSETDSWIKKQQIEFELKFIEESTKDAIKALQQLYSYGIVYEKYRNYIALVTFYDYLASGRCETLDGANGTYNLYEQEVRANMIIDKIDKVIVSLEQIKQNQYFMYNEMTKANQRLAKIENQLVVNNKLQKDSLSQLKKICENTDLMSEQMQKIAFNTEVTAFYSKQTKELTDALGYMVALG